MTDTAKLIAQARYLYSKGSLADVLADALEAAEAERDEEHERNRRWLFEEEHRSTSLEAENRRLREALEQAQAIQPRTLEMLREKGIVFKHAPNPNPDDPFELVAFWIYNDLCEADLIVRAALGGSGDE